MQMLRTLILICLAAATPVQAAGLTGTWSGTLEGEPLVLQLGKDGGGSLNGEPILYQQFGEALVIQDSSGEVVSYVIQQKGDVLTVSGGNLDAPLSLMRGKAVIKPKTAKSTPAKPNTGAGPELVGKWCYVSSFSANQGGGSQSSRCFELSADGRYTYQSEGSMSAYSGANSSGMWGGTSSSASDSGRWSLTGNRLTAQSDSGNVSTYTLEKRNHPKNRDPMICLDGDCYATYWNKAPW